MIDIPIIELDMLRALNVSRFKFYLSGSRYFENAKPDSDWDFFTNGNDPFIVDFLTSKGFIRIQMDPKWLGSQCIGIYRFSDRIEVELMRSIDLKKKAQAFIKKDLDLMNKLRLLPKQEKRKIWEEVYKQCQE